MLLGYLDINNANSLNGLKNTLHITLILHVIFLFTELLNIHQS